MHIRNIVVLNCIYKFQYRKFYSKLWEQQTTNHQNNIPIWNVVKNIVTFQNDLREVWPSTAGHTGVSAQKGDDAVQPPRESTDLIENSWLQALENSVTAVDDAKHRHRAQADIQLFSMTHKASSDRQPAAELFLIDVAGVGAKSARDAKNRA